MKSIAETRGKALLRGLRTRVIALRPALLLAGLVGIAGIAGCLFDGEQDRSAPAYAAPRLVLPDGSPASGAVAHLYFRDRRIPAGPPYLTDTADVQGRFDFDGTKLEERPDLVVHADGHSLYLDSIALPLPSGWVDTLRATRMLEGRVALRDGDDVRSVRVWALGTGLSAGVDADGGFVFPAMPLGQFILHAKASIAGYQPTEIAVQVDEQSTPSTPLIRLVQSPVVRGLQLAIDTLAGTVRLTWRQDSLAKDYRISRQTPEGWYLALRSTTDTTWSDTFLSIGGIERYGLETWSYGPIRVCPGSGTFVGEGCAQLPFRPVLPYVIRRSGMKWIPLSWSGLPSLASYPDFNAMTGRFDIQAKGDSLWVFFDTLECWQACGSQARLVSAWKSGDGMHWVQGFEAVRGQAPLIWRDSLWMLRFQGDFLVLGVSKDGRQWAYEPLPLLDDPGFEVFPLHVGLRPTPLGIAVTFQVPDSSGRTVPRLLVRGPEGAWIDSRKATHLPLPETTAGVPTNAVWQILTTAGISPGLAGLPPTAFSRSVPMNANPEEMIEFDGHLYAPSRPSALFEPNTIYASSVSVKTNWWYIDLPGVAAHSLTAWRGKLIMLASNGGVWEGVPTSTP